MIDTLIELATEAGMVIREIYESGKFRTSIKSDNSPVTTADEKANEIILRVLNQQFPKIPAVSEESENKNSDTGNFFIVALTNLTPRYFAMLSARGLLLFPDTNFIIIFYTN